MVANRRRSVRVACDLPLHWKRRNEWLDTRVLDINANGLFFATAQTIPINQMFDVTVDLPTGGISIAAVSRICGSTVHGVGIGAMIFVIEPRDLAVWSSHYQGLLAALRARVVHPR